MEKEDMVGEILTSLSDYGTSFEIHRSEDIGLIAQIYHRYYEYLEDKSNHKRFSKHYVEELKDVLERLMDFLGTENLTIVSTTRQKHKFHFNKGGKVWIGATSPKKGMTVSDEYMSKLLFPMFQIKILSRNFVL